jgi:hypothetical protein
MPRVRPRPQDAARGHTDDAPPPSPVVAAPAPKAGPGLSGEDVTASLGLLGKLLTGLDRIIEGPAKEQDTKLLLKGSVIDAFATLAGIQIKLIQLRRETLDKASPGQDARDFAARLRAAQREMEAVTRGTPDPSLDHASAASRPAGLPR